MRGVYCDSRLPPDHPSPHNRPTPTLEADVRDVRIALRHADVVDKVQAKIRKRFGPPPQLTALALLTVFALEIDATGSYERARLTARLAGLHSTDQQRLGLPGLRARSIRHKLVNKMTLRLERALDEGWVAEDGTVCDWDWFTMNMLRASRTREVPDEDGRGVVVVDAAAGAKAIAIDDTPYETWSYERNRPPPAHRLTGRKKTYIHYKDGPDGTKKFAFWLTCPDASKSKRSATNNTESGFYEGFAVTVSVAVVSVTWYGDPDYIEFGEEILPFVLAIDVNPAGTNTAPVAAKQARLIREQHPEADEVLADRGFTMKPQSFVAAVRASSFDPVMDYDKDELSRPRTHLLGRKGVPVIENGGTFFHAWMPSEFDSPPEHLRDADNRSEERRKWFTDRLIYSYKVNQYRQDGSIQIKNPINAGKIAPVGPLNAGTHRSHVIQRPEDTPDLPHNFLIVPPEHLYRYQRIPYMTEAWGKSYLRRLRVEAVNSSLKRKLGLSRESCKAMGLPAHRLAAVMLAFAYNLSLVRKLRYEEAQLEAAMDAPEPAPPTPEQPTEQIPGAQDTPTERDGTTSSRAPPENSPET